MCTAFRMNTSYFGRNLDLDRSYGEEVCVMPRSFSLEFRKMERISEHYAIIGMATVMENIPLFYDAVNEHGLAVAGLNFPQNAYYAPFKEGKDNITPFEFIPWILGRCRTVAEAKTLLYRINLVNIPFSEKLPLSPLHWIIADREGSIVAEQQRSGLYVWDNPLGVLTNNPPFEHQLSNLEKFKDLRTDNERVVFCETGYSEYAEGLGAVGLPGDVSSQSRFVRAAFGLKNSVCGSDELSSVGQVFHLLSFVEMPRGVCKTGAGTLDITAYSACMNINRGLYYYTTYDNRQITCVDMHKTDLDTDTLSRFPLITKQNILYQN